jgi:hypothetical protein
MATIRKPTRAQLAKFIPDQQVILALEELFDHANQPHPSLLFSSVADSSAIANTVVPTNFTTTYTIPADTLVVGKTLRFTAGMLYGTTGTPTYRLRVLLGTTPILDSLVGAVLLTGATDRGLTVRGEIACRSAGSSGTVVGGMDATESFGWASPAAPVTVATNVAQTLTLEWTWSAASASNTVKMTRLIVEAMN